MGFTATGVTTAKKPKTSRKQSLFVKPANQCNRIVKQTNILNYIILQVIKIF